MCVSVCVCHCALVLRFAVRAGSMRIIKSFTNYKSCIKRKGFFTQFRIKIPKRALLKKGHISLALINVNRIYVWQIYRRISHIWQTGRSRDNLPQCFKFFNENKHEGVLYFK